ncbi:OmpW/AlkL family protein [Paludibacterium denitrificans]|uniref:OmpW/AlkL family protein n=1 Tax=Paludibacterium denitrificans TaxID=2675226 RepID=UPI0028B0350E|nr:OmpW family outer membrane protein [Paludibacterium denitrificans]
MLPPTLTLQYHFAPEATFRPYAGVGVNYTQFYNVGLLNNQLNVDRSSWGPALQVGADYAVTKDIFVNFDVKKLYIKTDVNVSKGALAGTKLGTLTLDPWVIGVGIGTKF